MPIRVCPSRSRCWTASRAPFQLVTPMLGMDSTGACSGSMSTTGRCCSTMRAWSASVSIEITMITPSAPSSTHSSSHREIGRLEVVPSTTSTP